MNHAQRSQPLSSLSFFARARAPPPGRRALKAAPRAPEPALTSAPPQALTSASSGDGAGHATSGARKQLGRERARARRERKNSGSRARRLSAASCVRPLEPASRDESLSVIGFAAAAAAASSNNNSAFAANNSNNRSSSSSSSSAPAPSSSALSTLRFLLQLGVI